MKFAFIALEKAAFPVELLCCTLGVSRAGFYAWQGRSPAARAVADDRLGLEVAAIHAESREDSLLGVRGQEKSGHRRV